MIDLLLSADFLVGDADAVAARFVDGLGLPRQKPAWRQAPEDGSFVAHWLRVHPSLASAPTRLEIIQYAGRAEADDPCFAPYLDSLVQLQGPSRPVKTHATVLATSDIGAVIDRLHGRRVPFRIAPPTARMSFPRVWIGVTPEDARYRPDWDGGLMIEILPVEAVLGPAAATPPTARADTPPEPGAMTRVLTRRFLVRDLDAVVGALSATLGWDPGEPVDARTMPGCKRVRMGFDRPNSAALELVEPTADSAAARYLWTWGPGPYSTAIAVHDVDARIDELERRGTGFEIADGDDGRRVTVDPSALSGALVELVEDDGRG